MEKKSWDLGIEHEHDNREDVGVLHSNPEIVQGLLVVLVGAMDSRGLIKDNYKMHHLHKDIAL
jgi:hypothetical protein